MSVAVSRSDGLTVLTLTSDPSSPCPPLCQLLGALCYSPGCCSKKSRLTPHRGGAQTALGALWIITGLLHIGLGVLLMTAGDYYSILMYSTGYFPKWMGVLFLLFGVSSVLSERFPRPIFVLLSGLLNLIGVALSITTIVWYSNGLDDARWRGNSCGMDDHYNRRSWYPSAPKTMYPDRRALIERCEEVRELQQELTIAVFAVLIALSVLDLCLGLSSSIISFKTLKHWTRKSGNEPLLRETKE